jgi:hypothetical protein
MTCIPCGWASGTDPRPWKLPPNPMNVIRFPSWLVVVGLQISPTFPSTSGSPGSVPKKQLPLEQTATRHTHTLSLSLSLHIHRVDILPFPSHSSPIPASNRGVPCLRLQASGICIPAHFLTPEHLTSGVSRLPPGLSRTLPRQPQPPPCPSKLTLWSSASAVRCPRVRLLLPVFSDPQQDLSRSRSPRPSRSPTPTRCPSTSRYAMRVMFPWCVLLSRGADKPRSKPPRPSSTVCDPTRAVSSLAAPSRFPVSRPNGAHPVPCDGQTADFLLSQSCFRL